MSSDGAMYVLLGDQKYAITETSVRNMDGSIEMVFAHNDKRLVIIMSIRAFHQLGTACSMVMTGKATNSAFKPEQSRI